STGSPSCTTPGSMNLNGNLAATLNTTSFASSGNSGASNPADWTSTPNIDARYHTAITFAPGLQTSAYVRTSIAECLFEPLCSRISSAIFHTLLRSEGSTGSITPSFDRLLANIFKAASAGSGCISINSLAGSPGV